jgi:ABC-type lipoprotein export system ATPase subunit
MPLLECRGLSCSRGPLGVEEGSSIHDISARFEPGRFYSFQGPEGCGKNLLLSVLGLLEPADAGTLTIAGQDTSDWDEDDRRQACNEVFGFLFAHPCLLPSFSVAENVAMPLFRICEIDARQARERTVEVLEFVGLAHCEDTLASRLDPAERHRAALARAIVHAPRILVASSPREEDILLPLAHRCAKELGLCVLWAGDSPLLPQYADESLAMRAGRISAT